MSAETVTAHGVPLRFTVPAAGTARQVILPKWTARVLIKPAGTAAKYSETGTDAASIGSHYLTLPNDVITPIDFRPRGTTRSIYVESNSNAVEVVTSRQA